MQPEKAAAVRGWLSKAADDLRGARIDLDANPPFIEDALFHCQQAAEKLSRGFSRPTILLSRKLTISMNWDAPVLNSIRS